MKELRAEGWGELFSEVRGLGADESDKSASQLRLDNERMYKAESSQRKYNSEDRDGNIINSFSQFQTTIPLGTKTVETEEKSVMDRPINILESFLKPNEIAEKSEREILIERGNEFNKRYNEASSSDYTDLERGSEFEKRYNDGVLTDYKDYEKGRKLLMKPAPLTSQNWSQKNIPFILAQQNRSNQRPPATPHNAPRATSPTPTMAFRPAPPQNRSTISMAGFSGAEMKEQTYSDLGAALLAMEQDYDAVSRIDRFGPRHAFIQSAYTEGSDYIVDEAQVEYYPDETKLKVTQIIDSDKSTSAVPSEVTEGSNQPTTASDMTQQMVDAAQEAQKYAVDVATSLQPVTQTLTQKFNALDSGSKAMVIGVGVVAAKFLAPGIVKALPSHLMYLGIAAVLFSQAKK